MPPKKKAAAEVQWQWDSDDGSYANFGVTASKKLEKAWQAASGTGTGQETYNGSTYDLDWAQMTQKNPDSGRVRKLRRVGPDGTVLTPAAEVAPKAEIDDDLATLARACNSYSPSTICAQTKQPSINALAIDEDKKWFYASVGASAASFTRRAVNRHSGMSFHEDDDDGGDDGSDEDDNSDGNDDSNNNNSAAGSDGDQDEGDDDDGSDDQDDDGDLSPIYPKMKWDQALPKIRALLERGAVRTLRIGTGACKRELKAHTECVMAVTYSADGATLATGSDDKTVRLFDAKSGETRRVLTAKSEVRTLAFSPDGATIAAGCLDYSVQLWDVTSGNSQHVLKGHKDYINGVEFCQGGTTIATGSQDETVRLWDASSGKCRQVLKGHTDVVGGLACSLDGLTLATCSPDDTVRVWDAASGECRHVLQGEADCFMTVAISPDGATVATGHGDGDDTVRIWDVASGKCRLELLGTIMDSSAIASVAFSPDGTKIVSGSNDAALRVWDAASGECQAVLKGHTDPVWAVTFSPDGTTIASGCDDGTVREWSAAAGQDLLVQKGKHHRAE